MRKGLERGNSKLWEVMGECLIDVVWQVAEGSMTMNLHSCVHLAPRQAEAWLLFLVEKS